MSQPPKPPSTAYTYGFMIALCFTCALVLSVLASSLRIPQEEAKKLDRSKQMLMAAKILSSHGYFLIASPTDDSYVPAKHSGDGILVPGSKNDFPSSDDILTVFHHRISPILISNEGEVSSFEDSSIDQNEYLDKNSKKGFANLPQKLAYEILPNPSDDKSKDPEGYIFPVTGFGLWDRIYGYLAIKPDGDEVINIAWYKHGETPGLGANIANPQWQEQFPGKYIFERGPDGSTNVALSPLGLTVRRGKVADELGDAPKAMSAVDGMAGATLTGVGVSKAYKESLAPYRPFLIKLNQRAPNSRTS